MLKKIMLGLLAVLVIIQFIHPKKNRVSGPQANAIASAYPVPGDVRMILEKACYDCHSNNTVYPWYSRIQPVDWWLNNHVNNGKKHLNFDEYTNKSLRSQYHKMEEIAKEVKDGGMPLGSYTWMHSDAKLTGDEKNRLIQWANSIRDTLEAKYPKDSLIRKK
jgi:hypothetical protein